MTVTQQRGASVIVALSDRSPDDVLVAQEPLDAATEAPRLERPLPTRCDTPSVWQPYD